LNWNELKKMKNMAVSLSTRTVVNTSRVQLEL